MKPTFADRPAEPRSRAGGVGRGGRYGRGTRVVAVVVLGSVVLVVLAALVLGRLHRTGDTAAPQPTMGEAVGPTSPLPLDCAPQPSRCGFPDATNTGPRRASLVSVPAQATSGDGWVWDRRGFVNITADDTHFEGFAVAGTITVDGASEVVISDSTVLQGGDTFGIALRHTTRATVVDVRITAPGNGADRLLVGIKDIYGDAVGTVVRRCDISLTSTGVQIHEGVIENSYIHDLGLKDGDHVNGTTTNGGTGALTIRHNTVFNQYDQTDAISLFQDFGPRSNVTIQGNLVAGGGYTVYAGANPGKEATATDIRVVDNRFSTLYFPQGGHFGPIAAYVPGGGNLLSGNVWDATGLPVS